MKTRALASILPCCFFMVLLQLFAALIGPVVGTLFGALLALISFGILKFFQVEVEQIWLAVVIPVASSIIGVALVFFTRGGVATLLWLAPLLACAVALASVGIQRMNSRRCHLCNRRISDVSFACPRCGFVVCDSCWVFERVRCKLCEQHKVPIFAPDGRWWDKQLGPRTAHGRCQLCMTPAEQADLRPCRNCGRPQCRECWDDANGQCSRCQWTIEDLPEALKFYTPTATPAKDARVRAR
jgi:hypothetical protein